MLSENKQNVKTCYLKHDMKPLEKPIYIRLKFIKIGDLQFISHLDLHRTINRAIIRAGIPAWYTMGFNPHTKLVFATPLSVGTQSICEYLDIRIDKSIDTADIMERMNRELPVEMKIEKVYIPTTPFSTIVWSKYHIEIFELDNYQMYSQKIAEYLQKPEIIMSKHTKSGARDINIAPLINKFNVDFMNDRIAIDTVLAANSQNYLNPELLIKAIANGVGLSYENLFYVIIRNAVLLEDGETEFN